jgi:23S rRNA pseudouridine2605 synthase
MARERRNPRQPDPRKRKVNRPPGRSGAKKSKEDKPYKGDRSFSERKDSNEGKVKKYTGAGKKEGEYIPKWQREEASIRLNKYISNSGVCSRREADKLIKAGVIKVNGRIVTELGTKVKPSDKVHYGEQLLSNEMKRYILLNKQKGYVTTTKDPHAKNTVMELIAGACKERVYPVGRLDRNTVGLLLFTNDGELSKKLMHPSSRIKKLYHVVLDQPLKKMDMEKVARGVELDDGVVNADSIAYDITANDRREVGVELHSGKNRVIRRMFEVLGYKVVKLDRVMYSGLTKKNLPRGTWRFLTDQEVRLLKRL